MPFCVAPLYFFFFFKSENNAHEVGRGPGGGPAGCALCWPLRPPSNPLRRPSSRPRVGGSPNTTCPYSSANCRPCPPHLPSPPRAKGGHPSSAGVWPHADLDPQGGRAAHSSQAHAASQASPAHGHGESPTGAGGFPATKRLSSTSWVQAVIRPLLLEAQRDSWYPGSSRDTTLRKDLGFLNLMTLHKRRRK